MMTIKPSKKLYRIGVDVGGTNTDAVVACRECAIDGSDILQDNQDTEIIASSKSQTTPDVTTGIRNAIQNVITETGIAHDAVISVNIGTTHFINAVVQADVASLSRVAVLRLCGPFCREVPPFSAFPPSLRRVLETYTANVDGGLEIDGRYIKPICEKEIVNHARQIRLRGITTVVVAGVFSPLDTEDISQEDQVKKILQREIPNVDVVCSRDIGRVGFIERENAAILNASILQFALRTIRSFQKAIFNLGLDCPLYLTQNDGTIMDADSAIATPIKTFSSGATNSLTGAVFLARLHKPECEIDLASSQVIMVDIGGTTSDFAALAPSGFPRQGSAVSNIAGVRTSFSMPEVTSIGLGGGSLVRTEDKVTVGPLSVGHRLHADALCFGGSTMTATDIVLAQGYCDESLPKWQSNIPQELVDSASRNITMQIERCIETVKTSDADVVLLLVGGGSIIQTTELRNVKKCIRPPFYKVANAVGGAIAKVSGEIDRIVIPNGRSREDITDSLQKEAIDLAHRNGAHIGSVKVVEMELLPLQYVTNDAFRAVIKAVGELQWKAQLNTDSSRGTSFRRINSATKTPESDLCSVSLDENIATFDLEGYIPEVSKTTGEWFVSPTDLDFISEGCGILGTGGGGSVYSSLIHSQDVLLHSTSKRMRVIQPSRLDSDASVSVIAFAGSPSVSNERLIGGDELTFATQELSRFLGNPVCSGIMAGEIGGSNGMRPFAAAAVMDVPVIDADTLGRAFPKLDMSLPYVYAQASPTPAVLSDARGNVQIIARTESSQRFESIIRTTCVELGLFIGVGLAPLSKQVVEKYCCTGTVSFAWFIGREIMLARQKKSDVIQALLSVLPGGKLLYRGKVIDNRQDAKGGWTIGTTILEPLLDDESATQAPSKQEHMVLRYQNEFLSAELQDLVGPPKSKMVCTTPDCITVVDASNGTALGTHELKYGLQVAVVAMPAHPLWTTEAGLKASCPSAFGLDAEFQPLDTKWTQPPSVFETYAR